MQDSGKLLCGVKFNGQNIGQFYFEGCGSPDAVTADTPIIQIKIDAENNVSSDVPVITVSGLTLGASHEEVYSAMGNDYETGVNDSQIKYSENGVMRYLFGFRDLSDTDELAYILIYFNE